MHAQCARCVSLWHIQQYRLYVPQRTHSPPPCLRPLHTDFQPVTRSSARFIHPGTHAWMEEDEGQRQETSAICSTCPGGACRARPADNSPSSVCFRRSTRLQKSPDDPPPIGVDPLGYTSVCTGISTVTSELPSYLRVNNQRQIRVYTTKLC